MNRKTLLGFGFGPIQSGLILTEAQASGNYARYVIAEVVQDLVDAVRANGNRIIVNIAHADRVEHRVLEQIEMLNPRVVADRLAIADAIREADELSTAIPSVEFYGAGGESSIANLLAAHLDETKPRILYACENNNYAAEVLEERITVIRGRAVRGFQALNTVVGKMSGVIDDPGVIDQLGLKTMTPGNSKAVLVEAFNRILVSAVTLPGFIKGIEVFEEKSDLLPFEEAKLFGHNAIHALLGYLGEAKGYRVMSEIGGDAELLGLAREAFIDESGAALIRKHAGTGDPLFTGSGYEAYADDLLSRMTNPWLNDEIARVCRDAKRKLGYGDRLVGTMRVALEQKVEPRLMAFGAAAALDYFVDETNASGTTREILELLWKEDEDDGFMGTCIELVEQARAIMDNET